MKKLLKNPKVLLGFGVMGTFLFAYIFVAVFIPTSEQKEQQQQDVAQDKTLFNMPSLIANLSGSGGKRYLKVGISIEYYSEDLSQTAAFLETKQVLLTDVMLMILSSKTIATIDGYDNKKLLKEEIKNKFNEIMFEKVNGRISNVYFNTFLIQ
ncbi:flagellar basal body-associated FliL family protein [Candidatus Uabimicrobium amorphum]|uniref:Flagellar protein FliL n=1 Tax=Uabimicrobium amorphum TaxID=2596890 RepID=A0A5S9F3Z8_UABAM|nr:flagellar basal body-associated FliL family protein [Candidatus Uabimicrobium amorphum]BBM85028.1 flagellar protein FliL [Candidatus Uabimicrobium amorphum]